MSQDEDVELKDLVSEALEKNGVLAKIRAQLRASIFMTLENENGQKHQNPRLKELLSTHDGVLSLLLVQELVEFCNLIQTASIFKSETGQGKVYEYEGRQPLIDSFKLDKDSVNSEVPVLVHLIKLIFKLLKTSQLDKVANSVFTNTNDTSNERSYNESEDSPKGEENNTFLVNSGRSDHYDLSFVSDSENSVPEEKGTVLPLNLNNSSESNDSLSTEIEGKFSSKNESVRSEESSIKPDESTRESKNDVSTEESIASSEQDLKSDRGIENSSKTSTANSYSKYLSEKHKQNKNKTELNNSPPVDNIMKHFITSKIGDDQKSDVSISEEIIRAFSDSAPSTESSPRTDLNASPPLNILDETLPESPNTKQRVINEINNLKQQTTKENISVRNENASKIDTADLTVAKNEKNSIDRDTSKSNWSPLGDLPTLVISKNTKTLPCYLSKPSAEGELTKKPILLDPANGQELRVKNWPES